MITKYFSKQRLLGAIALVIAVVAIIIFYPQFFYCKNTYYFERYQVYFCSSNTISAQDYNALQAILNKTETLLKQSPIYTSTTPIKIFLRTENKGLFNLPYQFNKQAYAQTIPILHNIFVWQPNLKTDEVFIPSGHHRPLSAIFAHEVTHVLYEKYYGLNKFIKNWLDKKECTSLGFMWKDEGYAEYIAGGSGIEMKQGLAILNGHPNLTYHPFAIEYFKYWLVVKYLIEKQHLTLNEIVYTKMDFDTVLKQAIDAFNDH